MRTIAQAAAVAVLTLCYSGGPALADGAPGEAASWLDGVAGKTLVAIDGSSVTLTPKEGGLTREIVAPNGSVQKITFIFINDTLGTVADARDAGTVIGVFRDTEDSLDAQFADGHSETLSAGMDGGVSMVLHAPDGSASCMAWYPRNHVFNEADRQAALAEYAKRLGIALPGMKALENAADSGCPARDAAARDAPLSPSKPGRGASTAGAPAKTALAAPQSVLVRSSAVHPIDGDPAGKQIADENDAAPAGPGASTCLSVDSDGRHWGFRNQCDYAVQFAYCLKDGGNPLTACESGTVPGSVAAKGFAVLLADKTLSETDAVHNFRWVACNGGAGEVVAQLDRTSPPSGRCIRANAS